MTGLQIVAFLSGLAGLGATIGATVSNEWRATSRASSVITATWVLQGLWNNCAGNAIGALHCRPHHTILKLEGYIQAFGMKCTKIGGTDKNKARIACFAGVDFILSGLCSLSACSLYAHRITSEFFDPMFIAQNKHFIKILLHSRANYIYKGATSHSHISSYPRGQAHSVNQRPPPDYSSSSRIQQFDKNAYV
uniref:Claudin n=1 Tax=Scophthalmus maximus TaxID=52904 RepID=A0A8D3E3G4_SCOMX